MPDPLTGEALDHTLRAAGLRLGSGPESVEPPPALEHVIVSAVAASFPRDYRLLSVVTTWLGVHAARVHVGELARLLPLAEPSCADPVRFRAYWAGIAHWLRKDNRWSKVARMYPGPPVYLSRLDRAVANGTGPSVLGAAIAGHWFPAAAQSARADLFAAGSRIAEAVFRFVREGEPLWLSPDDVVSALTSNVRGRELDRKLLATVPGGLSKNTRPVAGAKQHQDVSPADESTRLHRNSVPTGILHIRHTEMLKEIKPHGPYLVLTA